MALSRPRLRFLWAVAGWALVALIIWFSLVPSPPDIAPRLGDKAHHLLAYFSLMYWFGQLHARLLPVALACVGLGLSLEWLQGLSGYRTASGLDMLANSIGVALAWLAVRRLPNPLARLEARWG